jgi:hypothetical protein
LTSPVDATVLPFGRFRGNVQTVPSAYTILPVHSLVITRGWGTLTDRDIIAHAPALAADALFAPRFCQLIDLRDIVLMDVTTAGIQQLVEANPFGAGARRAVVVGDDVVVYGMARVYELMRGETRDELDVFRDLDRGIQWLGLGIATSELGEVLRQTHSSLVAE